MANTLAYTIDDDWTLVAENVSNVAIQLSKQGQLEVHVADAEPDATSVGIEIGSSMIGMPSTFSVSALGELTKVWARSANGVDIVVLSY